MRKRMKSIIGIAAAVLAVMTLVAGPQNRARAATPNKSVLFYRHSDGSVLSGVLSGGIWSTRQTFKVDSHYTNVAVSRDTVMFYDTVTGNTESGYLQGGYYTPMFRTNLGAGYDKLTASCDTYLLYDSFGRAQVGDLTGGFAVASAYHHTFFDNYEMVSASCDTVLFYSNTTSWGTSGAYEGRGWLTDGHYAETMAPTFGDWTSSRIGVTVLTSTSDSYLAYAGYDGVCRTGGCRAGWGVERGGYAGQTGVSEGWGGWYSFAGSADSIIGYSRKTGQAGTATLVNGQYRYARQYWFPKDYTVMAGGK